MNKQYPHCTDPERTGVEIKICRTFSNIEELAKRIKENLNISQKAAEKHVREGSYGIECQKSGRFGSCSIIK